MNYTEELGLKLPELDESFDLEGHWNYNTEKLDAFAATTNTAVGTLESGLSAAQSQIAALQGGVHLKGSVNYYADLPEDPDDGDAYTVLYFGTTGQEPAGIEYAWGESSQSWIPIGVDPAAFAKPADIAAAIAALDVTETGGSGKYISAIREEDGKIEATPETMDTTPTANSTVPVTSGGVAASQATQDAEIAWNVNQGVKNLFDINATPVKYHITFTLTGGVLSGTSNGDWASYNVPVNLLAGDYTFSAVISNFSRDSGAGEGTIRIRITNSVSGGTAIGTTNITGNGAISIPFSWSGGQLYIQYSFNFSSTGSYVNSFTASNSMIRPAAITDPTFQPYALPNPVITPALIEQVDAGAKNKLDANPNSDTGWVDINIEIPSGDYVLFFGNLTSTDTDATTCQLALFNSDMQNILGSYPQLERGNNIVYQFTILEASKTLRVYASKNSSLGKGDTVTVTNAMICTAADWAVSKKFVPYCMTSLVDNLNVTFIDKANSRLNVYKYGKICFADISLKTNTSELTGADTITSTALPLELRPMSTFYATLMVRDVGGWALANLAPASFSIDTNGAVMLRTGTAHASAVYVNGYISWLTVT